jgi:hypothetical protein
MAEEAKKKTGWRGPEGSRNQHGRPKRDPEAERKTNREIKADLLLQLCRKLRPHLTKAVGTAVEIMGDQEANDQNRLKASALIIATYKDLVKDVYAHDDDLGEEMQEQQLAAVYSFDAVQKPAAEE